MRNRVEILFREHSAWLLQRMQRHTHNLHTAEDVVGETFAQLAAQSPVEQLREPRALLTTIAKRVLYNLWRRRDLERAYLDELAAGPVSTFPSPEQQLLVVQALEAIDQALASVPPKARQAFFCCQLSDMTYAQIAVSLGVSVSMVRQYVALAMTAVARATTEPARVSLE